MRKASGPVLAWEERSGDEAEIAGPKICQDSLQKSDCIEETPLFVLQVSTGRRGGGAINSGQPFSKAE